MTIFLKYKSKLIFFLTFIIVTLTIIAMIFKGGVPINKPSIKITYNFQVDGIWDSTHNVSKIFKVYID